MDSAAAMNTVFAVLLPELQFEFSDLQVVAGLVICAVACMLIVIDVRKSSKNVGDNPTQSIQQIQAEIADLIRRRSR